MNKRLLLRLLFLVPALGWFLWTFILTDRALVYSRTALFVRFQNFMWQFADNRPLQTVLYVVLVTLLFSLYVLVLNIVRRRGVKLKKMIVPLGIFFLFFVLSNPALSYDLFNYMFDAKMVITYHLDPHTHSAIDFMGRDDWVMFMRNVFFPTTYGYMWTALSLVPFVVGIGRLLLVYVSFKLYMFGGFLLLFLLQKHILSRYVRSNGFLPLYSLALFFLSPLVLAEVLSSGHNDIWMMLLVFASLAVLFPHNVIFGEKGKKKSQTLLVTLMRIAVSFVLLFASSQVKRSTTLLLPVWALLAAGQVSAYTDWKLLRKWISLAGTWWADVSALLLLAPLLTPLSRQFHPWYLVWAFSFIPFVRSKLLRYIVIGLSISSMLRYIPILYFGTYSDAVEMVQKTITWSALPLSLLAWYISSILFARKK